LKQEVREETALRMLNKKLDRQLIAEVTGLTIDQREAISQLHEQTDQNQS